MPIPENGVTLDTHKEATKHRLAATFALGFRLYHRLLP
jgi:hypothetical protein